MENDVNFNQAWYQDRRRHENLFPFSQNLMALYFMIQAELPERDRERLAQHFVLRGINVQDWTVEILKGAFRELFVNTRTSVQDPPPRPSDKTRGRQYYIMEYGDYDGVEGFWVEDENMKKASAENDDQVWFLDQDDVYAVKRVPGMKIAQRPKGHISRKRGKGKGKRRGNFRPYKPGKKGGARANVAQQDESEPTQTSGEQQWPASPDASWWTDQAWYACKPAYWANQERQQQPASHVATTCATTDGLTLQLFAFASAMSSKGLSRVLRPEENPTYVILDNGCTRSMGSAYAINKFVSAIHSLKNSSLECWYIPADTMFTFANGERGHVSYKLVIKFKTNPPSTRSVDVLEQGRVPFLFSIEQMRNLNMTIQHTTTGDYMTCDSFGLYQSFAYGTFRSRYAGSFVVCSEKIYTSPASILYDPDKEVIIGKPGGGHWIHIPGRAILIRQHRVRRKNLHVPT